MCASAEARKIFATSSTLPVVVMTQLSSTNITFRFSFTNSKWQINMNSFFYAREKKSCYWKVESPERAQYSVVTLVSLWGERCWIFFFVYYQSRDKSQDGNFSARRELSIQESFSILENEYFPILCVGAALTPNWLMNFVERLSSSADGKVRFHHWFFKWYLLGGCRRRREEEEDYGNMKI